ncbi:fibronectin type III domain-containing protein [Calditrichota bacterium LG25]
MNRNLIKWQLLITLLFGVLMLPQTVMAQKYKWLAAGSFHNWFSEMGCEIEVGRSSSANQQDGAQWPAILPYQDIQAAKGFWIGCRNFTDERGDFYEYKLVTVGPRSKGFGEFYPQKLELVSRFTKPTVFVDGILTYEKNIEIDRIDETIAPDMMVVNVTNTLLGLTMERKIMQFSTPGHDNYMIMEYTFTNTGNIDNDDEIELPNNTLEDVWFFYQYRWAPCFQTRYIIGNGTGWGMNTMHDWVGDGLDDVYGVPQEYREYNGKKLRAVWAWHGYFPDKVVSYDNIGGPIWRPFAPYVADYDTIGRLGATQFIGALTLHADKSTTDKSDDPEQPRTTGWYGSDLPETGPNSDPYNVQEMQKRYNWAQYGHMNPRHAWAVVPSGKFETQKTGANIDVGAPRSGKPGGFSAGAGYGPYTIGPGESIRIVIVEAVNGLSTRKAIEIGQLHKRGFIDDVTKNRWVLSGKDSLFKTFRNAIDNYLSGYQIERPPKPPKVFNVVGGGDRIKLNWEVFDEENLKGFRIYRMRGQYNNPLQEPVLIAELDNTARSFDDLTPVRGVAYYYYIQSVGLNGLASSRYWTQTYDPAFLKRPQGTRLDQIRVAPNPYIISAEEGRLRFPGSGTRETDKLAFFNIPGQCTIKIYTETGELIKTIEHNDGSGDEYWYATTSSNQVVVSGVYIAVIEVTQDIYDNQTGELLFKKGDKKTLKFVVIR